MINSQDRNIIVTYLIVVAIAGVLVMVIMNFNGWFFNDDNVSPTEFTPAGRDTVSSKDINTDLFKNEKFRSLGPLLSVEELKRLDDMKNEQITGTIKPGGSGSAPREVRHGNPFTPF